MDSLLIILPVLVAIALIWFTYTNINYGVTVFRYTRKDKSLKLCLNTIGKAIYAILTIVYIIGLIGGLVFIALNFGKDDSYTVLNVITILSIAIGYLYQQVIFVGSKQMLIGRILLDYRKIKRVSFPKRTKMSFAYGMKTFQTSVRFCDDSLLKKATNKTR